MAAKEVSNGNMIAKEKLYIAVFIALVVGFLGGVIFSSVKSGPTGSAVSTGPAPQQQGGATGITPEQAQRTLALEKEVAANPGSLDAWTQLGHVYFDSNRYDQAIRAYTKALAISPSDPNTWTDLGVMYRRSQQPQKALEAFDKARALNPRHEQSRMNKGIVLLYDLNDPVRARQAWEEVLRINPNAQGPGGVPLSETIKQM